MSEPIKVSAKEFERLQAMQETGQKAPQNSDERYQAWLERTERIPKRDVAGEVWDTTKKVGKVYLIVHCVWAVVVLIIAAFVGTWIVRGIVQIGQSNDTAFRQHSQAPVATDPGCAFVPSPIAVNAVYQQPVAKPKTLAPSRTVTSNKLARNRTARASQRAFKAFLRASAEWDRASEAWSLASDRWKAYQTDDMYFASLRAWHRVEAAQRRFDAANMALDRAQNAEMQTMPAIHP